MILEKTTIKATIISENGAGEDCEIDLVVEQDIFSFDGEEVKGFLHWFFETRMDRVPEMKSLHKATLADGRTGSCYCCRAVISANQHDMLHYDVRFVGHGALM